MTARLTTHPDVADLTPAVLRRLAAAGVDVELVGLDRRASPSSGPGTEAPGGDPLAAVRDGTIDLALVGIRALRGSAAEDLTTVAVLPREETRDVLVSLTGRATPLVELATGARVGLSGTRRSAFLAAHRPDVEVVPLSPDELREVIRTRADGPTGFDALVVSAIEARHAGLIDTTVEALEPKAWLPEPGQGALALIARHPIAEATAIDHLPTRTALRTELALLDHLDAPADVALGCLAQPSGRWIRLWAAAVDAAGRRLVRSDRTGPLDEPEALGVAVARELEARGFGLVVAESGA